ncbi:MAG: FkbM family methyltransferase [Terracidiphilus sp.]
MLQSLQEMLEEPVEAVKHRERCTLDALLASRDNRVVLFGAGGLGKRAITQLKSVGIVPLAISDNRQSLWGEVLDGLAILSPSEAATRFGADASFLITIWNEFHYFNETAEQLRQLGCSQVLPYTYLHWRFPGEFFPCLLNDFPHKLYEDRERVLKVETMWADPASVDLYRANIRFRAQGEPQHLPGRPKENTYLPADIFTLREDESVLDCGATKGEMTEDLLRKYGSNFAAFHALEADQISYQNLESYRNQLPDSIRDKMILYPYAVGGKRCTVQFSNTGQTGSRISAQGVAVECFPIDNLFASSRLTLIKMDIEGAEYEALLGGRKVIERDQPILAICVYHTQNDIWRIPLLLHDMLPEHKLFLRAYEGDGYQTVLFAVAPERLTRSVER